MVRVCLICCTTVIQLCAWPLSRSSMWYVMLCRCGGCHKRVSFRTPRHSNADDFTKPLHPDTPHANRPCTFLGLVRAHIISFPSLLLFPFQSFPHSQTLPPTVPLPPPVPRPLSAACAAAFWSPPATPSKLRQRCPTTALCGFCHCHCVQTAAVVTETALSVRQRFS